VKGHAYRPDTLYEVVLRDGGTTGFTKPDGRYLRLCRAVVRLGTPFPVSLWAWVRRGSRGSVTSAACPLWCAPDASERS